MAIHGKGRIPAKAVGLREAGGDARDGANHPEDRAYRVICRPAAE
jgi:hypothetical protein